jgi:hypothetical protein
MKIVKDPIFMQVGGIIERTFITKEGYYGVVLFNKGYRSGFVALPIDLYEFVEPTPHWLREKGLDYSGGKPSLYKALELKEHLWYVGFNLHKPSGDIDVETSHKFGVPGFNNKKNGPNVKTLAFVMEKINEISAKLTPQAIMEYKMRKVNDQLN